MMSKKESQSESHGKVYRSIVTRLISVLEFKNFQGALK